MKRPLKNFFQYFYLNKMELSQPFKKRYLLGMWNWGTAGAGTAAGFCIAINQKEIDNFLLHRRTIQKHFNIFA